MRNEFIRKNIGIFGLGRSGIAAFNALRHNSVICYDDHHRTRSDFESEMGLGHIRSLDDPLWQALELIIVSPGIPSSHGIFQLAQVNNIPVESDIRLFIECNSHANFALITGTNGKSTTVSLIEHIAQMYGSDYVAGGNIGAPVFGLQTGLRGYILELSSFQLELFHRSHSGIAVLLNIAPHHLDRHGTFSDYIRVKQKILTNTNINVIGIDCLNAREIHDAAKNDGKSVVGVSCRQLGRNIVSCLENQIIDSFFHDRKLLEYCSNDSLRGTHNRQNIAAAYAVCTALGIDDKAIVSGIASYRGLSHRLEFVLKKGKVSFYNDSKATNNKACSTALLMFRNIFWIAGGVYQNASLEFGDELSHVKKGYFYGRDAQIFANELKDIIDLIVLDSLAECLRQAYLDASSFGDECTILLAPGCASYDQYKNFEVRGEEFVRLVKIL